MPTRRPGYGALHDHKRERRSLILCPGSESHVALAQATAWQLELAEAPAEGQEGPMTLF
ncbi:hypothetical protein [Streptomyces hesseae]|uniref:Uncharacterized protein n=1 Tax=Streptomyces hesseae TaxID=3075519 RepID=A0ABU2SLS7_9ACTN|nr:hypothetical protein [Streptomyces sp. DSM 40473]MDT0449937.1 hypothetical protein [Streptomyces sp. DSM 40473]